MAAYGTDDGFDAWLSSQGLTLPADAPSVAVLREVGSAYVDAAYEAKLQCSSRAGGFAQELAWPRSGHRVNGKAVPDDMIPPAWVNASYRAAYLQASSPGWATNSADPTRVVKRQKVDNIEREFFAASETSGAASASGMASDGIIGGMVGPWLCSGVRRMDQLFRVI